MWPFSSICQSKARLTGKTVVITGGNGGIGKETARDLYWRGARVLLACRNLDKANEAAKDIKKTPPSNSEREQFQGKLGELAIYKLDLAKFSSVRECAKALISNEADLHIIINNAGVLMTKSHEKTEDGYELVFQSNYLSHFLLTLLLLSKIKASTPNCRIINVSSVMHNWTQMNFDDLDTTKSHLFGAYQQSKLANVLFAKKLSRKLEEFKIEGITTYSLHPGIIPSTEMTKQFRAPFADTLRWLWQKISYFFLKTPELGAQTTIHCAVDDSARKETGLYYSECAVTVTSKVAEDEEVITRLWNESLKMVGLPVIEDLEQLLDAISNKVLAEL